MEEERLRILKMVEAGQIDTEQATQLLAALSTAQEPVSGLKAIPATEALRGAKTRWSSFWIYPLMAGGGVLILGTLVTAWLYSADLARASCVCGWFPMLLGFLVMLLAWWSRSARWLHLRIREEGKQRIALSFPLPLSLAAWILRLAQPFVPQLAETGIDDLLIALRHGEIDGEALFIEVQDEEDGEHVQLYIG
jgi:cytochrome bd-type quinol oxidase subunit 1